MSINIKFQPMTQHITSLIASRLQAHNCIHWSYIFLLYLHNVGFYDPVVLLLISKLFNQVVESMTWTDRRTMFLIGFRRTTGL